MFIEGKGKRKTGTRGKRAKLESERDWGGNV